MGKNMIVLNTPEFKNIEESKANQIRKTFEPMTELLSQFEGAYESIVSLAEKEITKDVCAQAKRLRIDIGKVRIQTEKTRKEQKEEYLRAGKAIDGVSNILKWAVCEKENKLKEIEDYFETKEKERLEKLQADRQTELSEFIEESVSLNLAEMTEEVWEAFLLKKKADFEAKKEAERLAEIERIKKEREEAEERERIRLENERLKKEAAEREAREKAEREERERLAKIEAEKRAKEEAERREKERKEAAEKARIQAELEAAKKAKEEAERKEREAAERERLAKIEAEKKAEEAKKAAEKAKLEAEEAARKAKEEAERKEAEEKERLIQEELKKGDKEKISDLKADFEKIFTKYSFKAQKNVNTFNELKNQISSILKNF